jgi:hypothetical protein
MKKIKRPFEFEVHPDKVRPGTRWISVYLKNVSLERLTRLEANLHSRDPYFLSVVGTGSYLSKLEPDEKAVLSFQLDADVSTSIYATVSGYRDGTYFFWTSPNVWIIVGKEKTRLKNVFALTHPHATRGVAIEAEAVVEGISGGENLLISFWHDSPSSFEKIGEVTIKKLDAGEVIKPSFEFTPKESGIHEIYAYLYDDYKHIGSGSDIIFVEK